MATNPFLKPATPIPQASQRAQNLQAIAKDVHARTSKIEHIKALGQQNQTDIKNTQHSGSSRLSWLAQQVNKGR